MSDFLIPVKQNGYTRCMTVLYKQTTRVGILRACLRFIEDPTRNILLRAVLALAPVLIIYVLSPMDLVPELVLGPLGLADDSAILISVFLTMRLASNFYREQRYSAPSRKTATSTTIERKSE